MSLLYKVVSLPEYEVLDISTLTADELRTVWKLDFIKVLRKINGQERRREILIRNLKNLLEKEDRLNVVQGEHTRLVYNTLFALTDAFQKCKEGDDGYCDDVKKAVKNVIRISELELKREITKENFEEARKGVSSISTSKSFEKVERYLNKLGEVYSKGVDRGTVGYNIRWLLAMTRSLFHAVIPEAQNNEIPEDQNNEPKLKSNALLVGNNDEGVVYPVSVSRTKSNGLEYRLLLPDPQMIFINMDREFFESARNVALGLPNEAFEYNFFWRLEGTKLNKYPDKIVGKSMGIFFDVMCKRLCEM